MGSGGISALLFGFSLSKLSWSHFRLAWIVKKNASGSCLSLFLINVSHRPWIFPFKSLLLFHQHPHLVLSVSIWPLAAGNQSLRNQKVNGSEFVQKIIRELYCFW
jgi:hypothetical protein